jgi:signal transduction histidine kinase
VSEHNALQRLLQQTNAGLEQQVALRTAELTTALEEVRRAGQLKDEFLAAVSHELRTPLTGVLSMADLLQEQRAGPLNERQARYVGMLQQSGERLLELVESLLQYMALVSGRIKLRQAPCSLDALAAAALASVRDKAAAKGVAVEQSVQPPGLAIESDPDALLQVLKELLDNAVKFTPAGGGVGIEITPVGASGAGGADGADGAGGAGGVRIVVWDSGIGIARERQAAMFQPFVQGDGALARDYEGLGLGLAYVQRMVEQLGGVIALASQVGVGTRITITLGAGARARTSGHPPPSP